MKTKTICFAIATIVVFSTLIFGANTTHTTDYKLEIIDQNNNQVLAQEVEEFNISSYYDYARASTDILISKLFNFSTGVVFHAGDADWEVYQLLTSTTNYYWMIAALARSYETTGNTTYSIALSRAAEVLVDTFLDPDYPGFYVNDYAVPEVAQTKRPGVQAYAYWALDIAESVNASLDYTTEKQSAISCLTDMLYDDIYGGFFFYTMRNGSLTVPDYFFEVYPNDGKRLDHLSLGATVLYDAWAATSNTTLLAIAEHALNFLINEMEYYYTMDLQGLKLAVTRNGGAITVEAGLREAHSIVTDINAIAMKALLKGYETTGNETYLTFTEDVFQALLQYNWDTVYGAWFAETLDSLPYDPNDDDDVKYFKYSEIQFQMVLALEKLYEVTSDQFPLRLVIDTLELVLAKLWEPADEGFVRNSDQEWRVLDDLWETHYTAVQGQAVLALDAIWGYGLPYVSNVRIQPTNPRPEDLINFIVTAHDADGIDTVYVNYTTIEGEIETQGILELIEHSVAGGIYNNSMEGLADQTVCNFIVVANDTTGREFIAGLYNFIVRVDVFAPVVTLEAIYPTDEVRIGDDVVIDLDVYEFPIQSFVYDCELWWRVNSGPFDQVNMTLIAISGDHLIFRHNLGQFQAGDQLEFEGHIEDEAGNIGISPRYRLTILGPLISVTPIEAWQLAMVAGLVGAPGIGYAYTRRKRSTYRTAQKEGKKDAKRRARQTKRSRRSRKRKES
ncbi:MAG: hypothetical protein RTU63_13890 [Candidatus Thorarchaeota archaeon]